ncbi:hypothetical protein C5167_001415 [Papaver somniferum]|uniref:Uncharacterized protein n=1 Tax=Papaver somniferum TaxID=3469 RepID=A0A4Y7KWW1_PAPSO|nr:hypothetical protein C5167_001415 [Papaver somniferum]
MESVDYPIEKDEQPVCSSVARGGPIYIPDLTSPLISLDSFHLFEEDLSVDELKIYTEEELVEKALEVQNNDENEPPQLGKRINTSVTNESLNGSLVQVCNPDSSGILVERNDSKKGRKRGSKFDRNFPAAELESGYTAKASCKPQAKAG